MRKEITPYWRGVNDLGRGGKETHCIFFLCGDRKKVSLIVKAPLATSTLGAKTSPVGRQHIPNKECSS